MKEPKVIEIFADNGEHSHWQLIDENGEILWIEEPTEVKNNAVLPLVSSSVCTCGSLNYGYGFAKCYDCGKIKDI